MSPPSPLCYNRFMKRIDEDIKTGNFKKCYLLYGKEAYLKNQYCSKLLRAMVAEGDTMNFSSYGGKDVNPAELIDLAETMPFFAERRVILVQESGFFKKSNEQIAGYLKEMSESACFLFVETEADKRTKAFKAAVKAGMAVEFGEQKEALLARWVLGRIAKEKKKITKETMRAFLGRTGTDMGTIDRELEKLLCYTLHKDVVETADVEAVVAERTENKIFEMVDAISSHRQKHALGLYYGLLALKEAPMRILYLITRQLRMLAEIKELADKGVGSREIAGKAGVPEFAVSKYMQQARGFSRERLLGALEEGAEVEEAVKTGRLGDKIAVELMIIHYSMET